MSQNSQPAVKTLQMANALLLPEVIKLLQEGHTVTLPLRGNSMRPFLEDGRDKALLSIPKAIRVGDTVLAEITPGHYVLHRIVDISNGQVTLRGDGNFATEHCRLEDVKAIADHIMGQTPEGFNLKNADLNGDGIINAADIVELVNKTK